MNLQETLDALEAIRLQTLDFISRATAIAEQVSGEHVPEDPVFDETNMQSLLDDLTPTIAALEQNDEFQEIKMKWWGAIIPYIQDQFSIPLLSSLSTVDIGGDDYYELPATDGNPLFNIFYLDGLDPNTVRVTHPATPYPTFVTLLLFSDAEFTYNQNLTVYYSFMGNPAVQIDNPKGTGIIVGRAHAGQLATFYRIPSTLSGGGFPPYTEEQVVSAFSHADGLFQEMGSAEANFKWTEWSDQISSNAADHDISSLEGLESGPVDSHILVSDKGTIIDINSGISIRDSISAIDVGSFEERDTYTPGAGVSLEKVETFTYQSVDYVLASPGKENSTYPYTVDAELRLLEIDSDSLTLRDSVDSEYSLFLKTYERNDELVVVNATVNGEDVLTIKTYTLDAINKTLELEATTIIMLDNPAGVNDVVYKNDLFLAVWSSKEDVDSMFYQLNYDNHSYFRLQAAESDLFREMKNIVQLEQSGNVATDFVYIAGTVIQGLGTVNKFRKLPAVAASNIPFKFSSSGGAEGDNTAENDDQSPMITKQLFHGSAVGYDNVVILTPNEIGVEAKANVNELYLNPSAGFFGTASNTTDLNTLNRIAFVEIAGMLVMVTTSLSDDEISIKNFNIGLSHPSILDIAVTNPIDAKYIFSKNRHAVVASVNGGADLKLYEFNMDDGMLSWRSWNFLS